MRTEDNARVERKLTPVAALSLSDPAIFRNLCHSQFIFIVCYTINESVLRKRVSYENDVAPGIKISNN